MTTTANRRRTLGRRLLWVAASVVVCAAAVAWLFWPRTVIFYTDGQRSWPAAEDAGLRTVLWDAGDPLESLGQAAGDSGPTVAPDGSELYFSRVRPGAKSDLFVARRTIDGWTKPEPVAALSTPADEIGPALAPDGAALYFASNRPGGCGGFDLYVTRRGESGAWSAPANLGPAVNSPDDECDPALAPDGRRLLFASNRRAPDRRGPEPLAVQAPDPGAANPRGAKTYGLYALDLGRPGAADEFSGVVRRLATVSSEADDLRPAISPDGRWLYLASNRPGGLGGYDIWRARIAGAGLDACLPPENLGPPVNTAADERDPALTPEGFGLYFAGNRPATGGSPALYLARSHEVYRVVETRQLSVATVLGHLSWSLLAMAAALAGLAAAVLALAKFRHRPGLLAGSLLVSVILHLVALSLLTVWRLSDAVTELAKREDRYQVSVSVPGLAESELSAALRTALTDLAHRDTLRLDVPRRETLAPPSEVRPPRPDVPLAMAEPTPRDIAVALAARSAPDLAEPLLEPREPAPASALPPIAAPPVVEVKPVRPSAAPPEAQPRPMTVARPAPAEAETPPAAPAPPEPSLAAAPAAPKPLALAIFTPSSSPTGILVDARAAEPVRAPAVLDVGPVARPEAPSRPVRAAAKTSPGPVSDRPLAVSRPESVAPAAAGTPRPASPATEPGRPAAQTLLTSAAPAARSPTALPIGDELRTPSMPAASPFDAAVAAAPQPLPMKEVYRLRTEPDRARTIEQLGGTPETEAAVRLALVWFTRHQSPDGRWDVDAFPSNYAESGRRVDSGGERGTEDVGVTALAGLSFVGAGHTHAPARGATKTSEHAATVRKAIDWLLAGQKGDGDLRRDGTMYCHFLATVLLAESYSMTGDERLADPLRRAVKFALAAQNSGAGWRYEPRTENDTSVVGWALMALKSAQIAGVDVPAKAWRGGANWLDQVRQGKQGGLYVYQPGREVTPSMTAEGLFSQQLIEPAIGSPRTAESVDYILKNRPRWSGGEEANLYYWYYATMALHQLGGPKWDEWNAQVRDTLVKAQRKDGPFAGSWDLRNRWDRGGGRVYTTALATLTLEVYYRYLPFYAAAAEASPAPAGKKK